MEPGIALHYGSDDLEQRIWNALTQAGKDPDSLELKDLSLIDQLHTGGHMATQHLGEKSGLVPGTRILDAGCGIGGSSRLLAKRFNCHVTGLDLVDSFVIVARMLTRATGLETRVRFKQGDVCRMPFGDEQFDVVFCQHTLMNIANKEAALGEFARVLKSGGRLVLHEIVQGEKEKIHLPVPWADTPGISFLQPAKILGDMLSDAGFTPGFVVDATAQAKKWWQRVKAAISPDKAPQRPLGPHIIFGDNGRHFGRTMTANLEEDRIRLIEALMIKD
ncbi:MAG: class I SAM-dependent methyltransferase [Desulfobacteraceae bacterium]|nr:class I SAM-dependent methyltransferase [Desulfobacteraceae bacterium]